MGQRAAEPVHPLGSLIAAVFAGCAAHTLLALLLFESMLGGLAGVQPPPEGRELVVSTCGLTAVGVILSLLGRLWADRPDPIRSAVLALRTLPPAAGALASWYVFSPSAVDAAVPLQSVVLPILALCWSAAVLIAMLLRRSVFLLQDATRSLEREDRAAWRSAAPVVRIAPSLGRIGGHVAASVGLIVVAHQLRHMNENPAAGELPVLAAIVFLSSGSIGLGYASGRFFGESYARTLTSVTARFEQLASESLGQAAHPLRVPVVDDLEGLFGELERLRQRLLEEVQTYEQALEKTRAADEAKEQFLAAVSHELRTPLNSICGFAHLMLDEDDDRLSAAQREDLRLVRAGGHQLLALIDDILDVSMVETGEFNLSFEAIDLVPRLRELVSIHRALVQDKRVQLDFIIRGAPQKLVCDGRRIGQVVTNLLSNAIKFTDEGSIEVCCDFEMRPGALVVEVRDSGIGISEDQLGLIFKAYRQVGELRRRPKGTGLGLAISRTVVERHGGSLGVTSSAGEGSCFRAELPLEGPTSPEARDTHQGDVP